jgi:undecaprenol kinase
MFKSFRYASNGLKDAFKSEHNLRFHFLAGFIAVNLGYIFSISTLEWAVVAIAITLVIVMELVNTIVEKIVDVIIPQISETARAIKDISAAVVLFTALSSLIVGLLIFIPKIINLW